MLTASTPAALPRKRELTMNYSARTETSGSTTFGRCTFRERKLSSGLRGAAAAGGRRVSTDDGEAGIGSGDECGETYREVGSPGSRGVCNLRKRFAGRARTAFSSLQFRAQRRSGAVAGMGQVAELVQHR